MLQTLKIGAVALAATLTLSADAAEAATLRSGFDTNTLNRNDDGSTGAVGLGFTVDFFGENYSSAFVNNNGNITFDGALSTFTPFDLLSTNTPIIAPFFADVDTRSTGEPVTYGTGTLDGRDAFAANWINVAPYSRGNSFNSFQAVLIDRSDTGAGNFDIEFNYGAITWEAGTASGGDASGLGGNSARVGYSNGISTALELTGSAVNGAFVDGGPNALMSNSNVGVAGRYLFTARNGTVAQDPVVTAPVPVPAAAGLLASALGGLLVVARRRRKA